MIDNDLLKILVCPETRQSLRLSSPELLARVNSLIESSDVSNREGQPLTERLNGLLVREDNQVAYPIKDSIPVLVKGEGLSLTGELGESSGQKS